MKETITLSKKPELTSGHIKLTWNSASNQSVRIENLSIQDIIDLSNAKEGTAVELEFSDPPNSIILGITVVRELSK